MFVMRDASSVHIPKGLMNDAVGFSFNVGAVRAILASNAIPAQISIAIPNPKGTRSPSAEAQKARSSISAASTWSNAGKIGLALSLFAFFALPIAGIIGGIISFVILTQSGKNSSFDGTQRYTIAAEKVRSRIQFLQSNAPFPKLMRQKMRSRESLPSTRGSSLILRILKRTMALSVIRSSWTLTFQRT